MGKTVNNYPIRKNIRLINYDYSSAGYYFVTICVKNRQKILCDIVGATAPGRPHNNDTWPHINLTPLGICVDETIQKTNKNGVIIDKYIIMPNHIHMIIILTGDRGRSPLQNIVRNIKSFMTKYAGFSIWQRSFHDHIIRNENEYRRIWKYIDENPINWIADKYYT